MPAVATLYTVSDGRYFIGTVALLNSLRLAGNQAELVVLDRGLSLDQRDRLNEHARLVRLDADVFHTPILYKPFPHLLDAEGVVVVIDSDIIVTGTLDDILGRARDGSICLFPNHPESRNRWFAEWEEIFELTSPPRRQPHLNGGFIAFSIDHWPDLLRRWWEACARLPPERVFLGSATDPVWGGDEDALNAVLMSEVPAAAVVELPDEAPFLPLGMRRTRVVDKRVLACTYRGRPTRLLHELGRLKPWEKRAWLRVRRDAYVQLLPRTLFGPDVALRLRPDEVPLWLRPAASGEASLRVLSVGNRAVRAIIRTLPVSTREWVRQCVLRLARA
jgi:hypothetical protein